MAGNTSSISSWRDAWLLVKGQIPDIFTKGKVNFITIHYLYMIGMSLFFSVIIFGVGGMAYIDALFFASGACTQSGLNTIDINLLQVGQQVCFYIAAMFTNPIVIHGSVVFVRLYSFEMRFADVVRDARALRRTKSRQRASSFSHDPDLEHGDGGGLVSRTIRTLRDTGRALSGKPVNTKDMQVDEKSADSSSPGGKSSEEIDRDRRASQAGSDVRMPAPVNPEQHIRFLEQQRNPDDTTTLRIPSPREFDRGGRPENIDDVLAHPGLERQDTRIAKRNSHDHPPEGEGHLATHLTFNEPTINRDRRKNTNLSRLNTRRLSTQAARPAESVRTPRTLTMGSRSWTLSSFNRSNTMKSQMEKMAYLSYAPTVTRNSFFVNLTQEQRDELGGIEYRALKTLALILIGYFVGFHLFGVLCLTPWIYRAPAYGAVVTGDGQGRTWWGFFTAASAFNDLGFTLTPDSMLSFSRASWPLLSMTYLIIIGNTGFPCMLRFTIWFISKLCAVGSPLWEELQFLLDHPRRCFTLLFPRAATWWLFSILVLLNGVDLIFFVILDLKDPVVSDLPGWYQFLDGLFQAASTRTAGFSVVNLAALHPAIQVSYLVMMYISVYPIAISVRRTNVYEEKSLGVYGRSDDDAGEDSKEPSYVGAHLRRQLGFDLWYVFLGLFIIAIVEGDRLQNTNEYAFTIFSVLFEIVSAYGTVGLSLGYPGINASFSAEFRVISKLVIVAMMIRGRHRGLPYELDRAVLLPSESLHAKEAQEAARIISRRPSMALSTHSAVKGDLTSPRFRPETGLASGTDHTPILSPRERSMTNRSHTTIDSQQGVKPLREGSSFMFKTSSKGPDMPAFREEAEDEARSGRSEKTQ